ncbi:MAG: hypothetical protein NT045_08095 [Candidatus Aureabacteria bacterium]|nr:hypothetical protein [Candidatus Auribacterota bacterium]
MVGWCILLFIIGLFGVLQNMSMISDPDRTGRIITWILMLVVAGILVRIRGKEKTGEKERLRARIAELERELRQRR